MGSGAEELLIRRALSEDLDAVGEMYRLSIDWLLDHGIHQWRHNEYPTRDYAEEFLSSLYVAESCGDPVATFVLNDFQIPQFAAMDWKLAGRPVVLHTLVVHPDRAGKGIGKRCMEYALQLARDQGYEVMRLDVFPGNTAAVNLYKSLGFHFAGRIFYDFKEPSHEWYECYEREV